MVCVTYGISGILLPKLFWPNVRKNCSSDREKLLKFEAEGREQFIQTAKGQNNFWNRILFFNLLLDVYKLEQIKIKFEKIIGIQKPTGKVRKRIEHIPIASFSCLTSARNSECPGENLAFSPLSYWWIVCSEAGRGWQSASQMPLRPRSQWISFGDAIQSRRSETRSTAFSDTATISSWNVNEQKTL